jgi:hypothetical protein
MCGAESHGRLEVASTHSFPADGERPRMGVTTAKVPAAMVPRKQQL